MCTSVYKNVYMCLSKNVYICFGNEYVYASM